MKSLDNSNGVQYYGGNDPAKMSGRIKKGQVAGGGKSLSMNTKGLNKRDIKKKTGKLLRDIRNNKAVIGAIQGKGKRAYTSFKGVGEKTLLQKRGKSDGDLSRNAGIQSAKRESQGQLNLLK